MSRKKKKGGKDKALQAIVFATAIFGLVDTLMDIIKKLIE